MRTLTKLNQKADFTGKKIYAGIDSHKKNWAVTLFLDKQVIRTFTQPASVDSLVDLLRADYPGASFLCGYESGFSGFWIQRAFQMHNIPCYVLHAGNIPHSAKQRLLKNDPSDSRAIGSYLSSPEMKPLFIPDIEIEQDRGLVRYRTRLLRDIKRCKNRIRSLLLQFGVETPKKYEKSWSKNFIQWLKSNDQINGTYRVILDRMIEQMLLLKPLYYKVNKDIRIMAKKPEYDQKMKWLLSIPGIGPLTSITLITELIDIHRFSSFKDLNSYVGLYPMEHSTGTTDHKGRIMVMHNKHLRRILIEDAWVAIRHDPALLLAYQNFIKRMSGKRAIVKIARKLLSRIRFVLMNECLYSKGVVKTK